MARTQMDLTGQTIDKLTILSRADDRLVSGRIRPFWNVKCECGTISVVGQTSLRSRIKHNKPAMCSHCAKIVAAHSKRTTSYFVRRDGRVWSFNRRMYLPQSYSRKYLAVKLLDKRTYIHRLVAEKYIPNPENKPQVNHIDGNPSNNHVSNLEWSTNSENIKHAYDTGLNQTSAYQKKRASESNEARAKYPAELKLAYLKRTCTKAEFIEQNSLQDVQKQFCAASIAYKHTLKRRGLWEE